MSLACTSMRPVGPARVLALLGAESTGKSTLAAQLTEALSNRGLFRNPARLQAVGGVTFSVQAGKTLAVVGESGCGKSTLARMVALIETPHDGQLQLKGVDVVTADADARKALRQQVQLVFQNPYGSLYLLLALLMPEGEEAPVSAKANPFDEEEIIIS